MSKKKTGPELSSHRNQSGSKRVPLTTHTYSALKKLSEEQCMTLEFTIESLIGFYNLQYFDLLIEKIRDKYNNGLSPIDIAHLSVLYTLLQSIDQRIGLR